MQQILLITVALVALTFWFSLCFILGSGLAKFMVSLIGLG